MKKMIVLHVVLTLLLSLPNMVHAEPLRQQIEKACKASNYDEAAILLEQELKGYAGRNIDNDTIFDVYHRHLLLAHVYAWKLNKYDLALEQYNKAIVLEAGFNNVKYKVGAPNKALKNEMCLPSTDILLYMGAIYEQKGEYARADECYQKLLTNYTAYVQNRNLLVMLSEFDMIKFIKYTIDSLHIKTSKGKAVNLLLPKIYLASTFPFPPFLLYGLVPTSDYEISAAGLQDRSSLARHITKSPENISTMFLNYGCIMDGDGFDANMEKAIIAYSAKYSDSYLGLNLRHLLYRYYKSVGQVQKAKKIELELKAIADKRKMQLSLDPDPDSDTPEKTWASFKKALSSGDIISSMGCFLLERPSHNFYFDEMVLDFGKGLSSIEKISEDEEKTKYKFTRSADGSNSAMLVYFVNLGGEWKILDLEKM